MGAILHGKNRTVPGGWVGPPPARACALTTPDQVRAGSPRVGGGGISRRSLERGAGEHGSAALVDLQLETHGIVCCAAYHLQNPPAIGFIDNDNLEVGSQHMTGTGDGLVDFASGLRGRNIWSGKFSFFLRTDDRLGALSRIRIMDIQDCRSSDDFGQQWFHNRVCLPQAVLPST